MRGAYKGLRHDWRTVDAKQLDTPTLARLYAALLEAIPDARRRYDSAGTRLMRAKKGQAAIRAKAREDMDRYAQRLQQLQRAAADATQVLAERLKV